MIYPAFCFSSGSGGKTPWQGNPAGIIYEGTKDCGREVRKRKEAYMLLTLAVILIVLWLLGLISSYTLGGWLHLLLVAAIITIIVQLVVGRRGPQPPPV